MVRRRPLGLPTAVAAVAVLPAGASSLAAQARDSLPYPIGEVVVTAPRAASEAVTTTRVVDSADLRAADARTLADALPLLPGVVTRLAAEGVPRVDIRGYRTRQVLLLLDGIPINSTFDGQFDPTLIPAELIDAVKLTAGAPSVLYGQGGLAGVLNVQARRAGNTPTARLQLEGRELGGWAARGSASARRGPLDGFVAASAITLDAFPSWAGSPTLGSVAGARRSNSDRDRYSVFGKAGYAIGSRAQVAASGEWLRGHYGVPPSISGDPADSFAQRPRFERVDGLEGGRLQLALSAAPVQAVTVRTWAFGNWLSDVTNTYADSLYLAATVPGTPGTARDETSTRTIGAQTQVAWRLGRIGRLTGAAGVEGDRWHAINFS
ncbi:MAG TPA: TonB-dependent receptor plug domain-containing protein, partial [Gemmatimonadales bacterium]|nr:TonB-dependent receptor plug domain-containing protein [Gemmatimonadales bacterium]